MGLFSFFDDKFLTFKLKEREFTDRILPLVKGCINNASLSARFVNKNLILWSSEKYAIKTQKFFAYVAL